MNRLAVYALVAAVFVAAGAATDDGDKDAGKDGKMYTSKYDHVDIEAIFQNLRLLRQYFACLIADTDNNCSPEGKELKGHISDALKTDCSKCSDLQKENVKKVIHALVKDHPDMWKELTQKYDPNGEYQGKHAEELEKAKMA